MDILNGFLNYMVKRFNSQQIRSGTKVRDNVFAILEDVLTGERTVVSCHNITCNFEFSAINHWIAGRNNTGQNAISPPSQIMLGTGSGTPAAGDPGLFSAITSSLTDLSYATPDSPQNGTCTLVFQIPAGKVTQTVTEALLRDASGNPWNHTMFAAPFTPTSSQNITIIWEKTYSN